MSSLRARVAVAAVAAVAGAFVLSGAVVVGTFALQFHERDGQAAQQEPSEVADAPGAPAGDPAGFDGDGPPPFVRSLALRLGLVSLGVLGLVGAVGLQLGGAALRPLAALRSAAGRVASTRDLATRLPHDRGPEEVDALAASLNAMLARLQQSTAETEAALEASRRFAADAGHELRTPLTSMRTNLDVLAHSANLSDDEQRILTDVAREQHRLLALLDGLQQLARGDAAEAVAREHVDLADTVEAAVASAGARHATATITVAGPHEVAVNGWPDGLRLLVDNLLDNALRHGRPNGRVDVSLADDGPMVRLTIDDDGPGIPARERQQVFARFARGSAARASGSGLGLALVAQQAAAHRGHAVIEDSPLGGTRVTVRLARAPEAVEAGG